MPQNYDTCSPNNTPPTQYTNSTNLGTPVLNYDISFPYIAANDIVVFTGDTGNWTLRNQGTGANEYAVSPQTGTGTDEVVFVGGTPGANILITRRTDICAAARVFQAGSSIRAEDLNTDMNQLRFLYQELYSFLEMFVGNEGDELVPGENPSLDDLADVEITTPANPSWLRWNGTQWEDRPILEAGDAWQDNDDHVVTAAAGDDRWLTTPGGGGTTITAGDGIRLDAPAEINVDLAATSGLEFDGGDLRIDVNDGCEIVADGLNAETTAASIIETGGNDQDPAIRIATSLGTATTNNDLQISGGANVTVTRNNANQLTIASAAATGGATFRGTVDVDNNNTLPGTTGQQNPNAVAIGDGFTVENNVAAADVTANWNTVLDNWDTADGMINSGDVILCITAAAAGSPTDARYNLIRTGGNVNTLQQVTDAGNTTTNGADFDGRVNVGTDALANRAVNAVNNSGTVGAVSALNHDTGGLTFQGYNASVSDTVPTFSVGSTGSVRIGNPASATITLDVNGSAEFGSGNIELNEDGSAHFNAANNDADFRVDGDNNDNMLFVDAGEDRVGIGTGTPGSTLDVRGSAHFNAGNEDEDFRVDGNNADNVLFVDASADSVGIGTNTPGEIAGMSRYLTLSSITEGDAVGLELQGNRTGNDQVVARISFINDGDENARITVDSGTGAGTNSNMIFATGGTGERMRITSAGRVGINDNDPDSTLAVNGQVTIDQNAITAGAGNWNLAEGNFWTLGAIGNIPNPTGMVAGMSGLIVYTAAANWPVAGGAVFQYAGNTPPDVAAADFPAVIPFYCRNDTEIFIGTPTVNIT